MAPNPFTRIAAGEFVRCQSCHTVRGRTGKVICAVPEGSLAIARALTTASEAAPGSGVYRCDACNGLTEFRIAPAPAGSRLARAAP